MKKNVTILCMAAIFAVLLASCSGGGGGLSNLFTSVEGAWIDETAEFGIYGGFYLSDGKVYMAFTKDKETIYYTKENFQGTDPGTYTSSGSEVKITMSGVTGTATRDGDTMIYTESGTKHTMKKRGSAKIEAKTATELDNLISSWVTP